jgi:hypothetical protein
MLYTNCYSTVNPLSTGTALQSAEKLVKCEEFSVGLATGTRQLPESGTWTWDPTGTRVGAPGTCWSLVAQECTD